MFLADFLQYKTPLANIAKGAADLSLLVYLKKLFKRPVRNLLTLFNTPTYYEPVVDIAKIELEELLGQQTQVILGAVDERFLRVDTRIDEKFKNMDAHLDEKFAIIEKRIEAIERNLQKLTTTLDVFLQRLNDNEQEFTLLKAKVDRIASFIKDRFNVEISMQG